MTTKLMLLAATAMSLAACTHAVDEFQEIGPNETAFLVSLEGDTKTGQAKFDSLAVLEQNKIAAKRVVIPHKLINVCPSCTSASYRDVPTARLFKIDRSMVTREWTATAKGTAKSNQAISVESSESIDFDLGAMITAHVAEEDAAKFLYSYAGKQLAEIIDQDVRSLVSQSLSAQFGSHTLEEGRHNKINYFSQAKKDTAEFFKTRGITIDSLGLTEGMAYRDVRIQDAINKKFEAEIQRSAAVDQAAAAATLASNKDAVLMQQNLEIRKRELDIQSAFISKWNGVLPQVQGSSNLLQALPPLHSSTSANGLAVANATK